MLARLPAHAAPLSIEDAVEPSGLVKAALSPDGKHIAAIIFNGTNYGLFVIDTTSFAFQKISEGKRQDSGFWRYLKAPRDVTWAGNETLAIDYGLEAESAGLQGKKLKSHGEEVIGPAQYDQTDSTKLLVYTDVDDGDVALCDARTGKCSNSVNRAESRSVAPSTNRDGCARCRW